MTNHKKAALTYKTSSGASRNINLIK